MFGFQPKERRKPQAGAAKAQAQNAAPDTIPGMFKPGEFVLPPDTVHAMGGKDALQGVVDATHTPVNTAGQPAGAQGFQPQVFFANGGAPEDEMNRAASPDNTLPGNSGASSAPVAPPSEPVAAVPAAPAVNSVPAQTSATSPGNTFPGNRLQGASGFSGAPAPPPAIAAQPQRAPAARAPAAAPVLASNAGASSAMDQIPTDGYPKAPKSDGSQQGFAGSEAGRNINNALMALPGGAGQALAGLARTGGAVTAAARGIGAATDGVSLASRGFSGGNPSLPAAQAATVPNTANEQSSAVPPTPAVPQDAWQSRPGYGAQSAGVTMGASNTEKAAVPEVAPGVYQHGRGQYSDQAGGMGFNSSFTGQPSAQNMRAADALQSRPATQSLQQAQAAPAGEGEGSYQAPVARHSGNDWQARQHLKNLETSASSIMNDPRWAGKRAYTRADTQNFMDAQRADLAAQGKQPGLDLATMGQNTNQVRNQIEREKVKLGALHQSRGFSVDQQRLAIEGQRAALDAQRAEQEMQGRGFDIRAAQRTEQVQDAYSKAKTDAERAKIAAQIRGMSGKSEPAEWALQVTPASKNVDGSTNVGSVYKYNKASGAVERVDSPATPRPPVVGAIEGGYKFKGGDPAKPENWVKA